MNPKNQFEVVGDKVVEYRKVIVYEFFVDSDDVAISAAEHLWKWEHSEMGIWVMNHAVEQPAWFKQENPHLYGAKVYIVAKLTAKDITFWQLKWGNDLTLK